MRRKKSKFTKAELLNRAIEAWERRQEGAVLMLRKSAEMLVKLRRQRLRMLKRTTAETKISDELITSVAETAEPSPTRSESDTPDIPGFLDRTTGRDKDAAARAEIKAELADKKKRAADRSATKRKIGQETKHAELTGQRRKMPLSGKAALAAIRAR